MGNYPLSFWVQKTQNLAAHHSRSESGRLGDVKISDSLQTAVTVWGLAVHLLRQQRWAVLGFWGLAASNRTQP